MQVEKKKKLIVIAVVLVIVISLLTFIIIKINDKNKENEYYYTFKYDDNLITQSVKVYNKKDEIQSNYYIFYKNEVVSVTKGENAVLTISKLDLKDKPEIEIMFRGQKEKIEISHKK